MKISILFFTLVLFVSCSTDDTISTKDFEPISEEYPFRDLDAGIENNYWELVQAFVNGPDDFNEKIIGQNGVLCASEEDDMCKEEFNNLKPEYGFAPSCLPGLCFYYLKYQANNENNLVASTDDLLQFLGAINTKEEALLWIRANDYYYRINDIDGGAIKATNSGFELILLKTVSYCTPIQTNRYHLKLTANGDIEVLKEKVFSVDKNSCV